MIVLAYLVCGILALITVALMRADSVEARTHRLNVISLAQGLGYLGITVFTWLRADLPVYYLSSRYVFVDALGIYEALITSVVFLLAAVYARGYVSGLLRTGEIDPAILKLFYGAFSALQIVITLSFFANNLALFWILLELTTVFSAMLIVTLNAKENIVAALKYLFVASTAMLFSIIGLIVIYAMSAHAHGEGTLNWDLLMEQAADFSPSLFTFAFVFTFIGFAAKSGIVPFHTWLPPAHAKAPSVVSALLSAVLLNVGMYGVIRLYAIGYHTPAKSSISTVLLVFGTASVVIAALCMLPRTNVKKLIAYSSIEHMGLMLIGIGVGAKVAMFWVLFHALGHALVKALLFFSAGILHCQYGTNKLGGIGNALGLQPLASWGMILGSAAIIGTPLFPVFLSKLFILEQAGDRSLWLIAIVLPFLLVVAVAFAVFLVPVFTRKEGVGMDPPYHAPWTMKAPIVVLLIAIVVLGLYFPSGLTEMLNDAVAGLGF